MDCSVSEDVSGRADSIPVALGRHTTFSVSELRRMLGMLQTRPPSGNVKPGNILNRISAYPVKLKISLTKGR